MAATPPPFPLWNIGNFEGQNPLIWFSPDFSVIICDGNGHISLARKTRFEFEHISSHPISQSPFQCDQNKRRSWSGLKVGNYNLLGSLSNDVSKIRLEKIKIIDTISAVIFSLFHIAADDRIDGQRKFHFVIFLSIVAPTFFLSFSPEVPLIQNLRAIGAQASVGPFLCGCFVIMLLNQLVNMKSKSWRQFRACVIFLLVIAPILLFYFAYSITHIYYS